ncbi:MAG: hypothetical protein LH473_08325 [Chitinophagales bacterium]|nr:hypothetical protein [Chitinophagales bacterium]
MPSIKKFIAVSAIFLSIASSLYFTSCSKDKAAPIPPADTSCTQNGTDSISFMNDIVPIMITYCTDQSFGDCHGTNSSLGYDFTTYDLLQPYSDGGAYSIMYDFVISPNATMPKSISNGPVVMESCDKEKLNYWLLQGGKNN